MNEVSPHVADDCANGPAVAEKRSRLTGLSVPDRGYDVDSLLVELGPGDSEERGGEGAAFVCHRLEDLYRSDSRFAIQAALAEFLESRDATATELLHGADLQRAVVEWPRYGLTLETIAAGQAAPGRWTAGMRADELRALATEVVETTRRQGHRGAPPGFNARRLSSHVRQTFAATTGFRARYAVDTALAAWLSGAATYEEKLMQLLALDGDDLSPEAAEMVDQFVGEILSCEKGCAAVLAGIDGLGPRLRTLAEIWRGAMPGHAGASTLARRLAGFSPRLTGGWMRRGIEASVFRMLEGGTRFRPVANSFEARKLATVLEEFDRAAETLDAMGAGGTPLGGEKTVFLFDHRLARLLTGDALEMVLRGKSHHARITDLLALHGRARGPMCRQTLVDVILEHFEARDFVQRIFEMLRGANARLKVLSDLHRAVAEVELPEPGKGRTMRMLDELQYTFMRTNRVLARISVDAPAGVDDVLEFVGMLADGVFIEGKSAAAVRQLVGQHLRSSNFIRGFVARGPGSGETRAQHFRRFFERTRDAGLRGKPMEAMRVLLVDDEPQAREYVAMILGDLGVVDVVHVGDGEEASVVFERDPDAFDLIVCDWRMPRLSGLDFLKRVRASRPHQAFLMVTALSTLIAVEEAMAHDVTAYVAKPFTPEQLETKVLALVHRPDAAPHS